MGNELTNIFNGLLKQPDGSWSVWKIVFLLLLTTVIVVGLIRRGRPKIRNALTGTARVLSLQPTRAGNEFGHVCQVGLQVNVAGRPPYDVMIRQAIHVVYLPRVQPGAILPVQVDPADPQKVLLDFEGPGAPQP